MLLNRQIFRYRDKIIIEKIIFSAPYKQEVVFQNGGCFMYIKGEGSKLLSVDDKIQVKSREAVLLKCGTYFLDMVKNVDDDVLEVIAFHLFPDILTDLFADQIPELIEKNTRNPETQVIIPSDTIAQFVESLEFYFKNPTLVSDNLLELKIKELILLLVQTNNVKSIIDLLADLYSSRTVNLQKTMTLHIYSNLSMKELAKICNLSLSSFKREFKKAFNDSPANYILTEKLKKAKKLLAISDLPINEIAYETGFNDPLYFTRQFKSKTGLSPTNYRKINAVA
ncbi:helix-turn-helix domain-containing protein [Geofilum sp. OHC36d9]|uniref:helix-turn-helix domain-containing protein n=1 Tax=Geofilum sp. OHC36d9 TaxID=3458413 RepID=UPI004033EA7C